MTSPAPRHPGVLFDVDGTLLDTNYQHVLAWALAFRDAGYDAVDLAAVHRLIGRSSPELVAELIGEADAPVIDEVVEGHSRRYEQMRELLEPRIVTGGAELVVRCAESGLRVVLATSASEEDLKWMGPALGVEAHVYGVTTASHVEESKPAPELLELAIEENDLDPERTVMVGDAVWDVLAGRRAGLRCIGVTSGGTGAGELGDAGADEVWAGASDLLAHWDESLLSRLT
ncbi:HAD family hydrolase [Nocardioides mesophilus]|uniref:HAD family hydrolase n=1 Tax=Nocardioides mesophilus TaxID=433659 RepID=A0A7G9RFV7_9ACTN|nr:HAD family hydrolase [Nocardioides mesophilus]QNN54482.1 HAD family hydrolase [Nocardioides mesophilus]